MSARDAFLEIVQGAQVLDDVATGVVEENLAVLVTADRHQPLKLVAVLKQLVYRLRNTLTRQDGYLGARAELGLFSGGFLLHVPKKALCLLKR